VTKNKLFLSGNEAIAKAALDFGCKVGIGYPGTPSTEILENMSLHSSIKSFWAPNEKVALEYAIGACYTGCRAIVTMKHVGLNVAADPFMNVSYTGVKGGLIIVSCDDPGIHSSQNEQDNRNYAKFAKIPMLEPSSPDEAYRFIKSAFEISEKFDTPVLYRMTIRISHSNGIVNLLKPVKQNRIFSFQRGKKYVLLPGVARERHKIVEKRLEHLQDYSDNSELNQLEDGKGEVLLISSGVTYQYAKEEFPEYPILKIGMSYPLPIEKIKRIAKNYKEIICLEELDPFIEENLLNNGINNVRKRNKKFYIGEMNPSRIKSLVMYNDEEKILNKTEAKEVPPSLCKGCPHSYVFEVIKGLHLIVAGDIGCYTLGALSPYNAIHTTLEMGASIPMGFGIRSCLEEKERKRVISVIGDSTFIHSGIPGLIDAIYNKREGIIVILDNDSTAMTGGQDHPGTGRTLQNGETFKLDIKRLCEICGAHKVYVIDPYKIKEAKRVFKEALNENGVRVVIARKECLLKKK